MYFSARKSSAPAFVGPLDALRAQGASFMYVASMYRMFTTYTGSACRLQGNGTGSPEADIPFLANGQIDLAAAAAIAAQNGGTEAFGVTWYNQMLYAPMDATQSTAANRMKFSTALNAKGGWGDGVAASGKRFNLNLGTLIFPIYVSAVVRTVSSVSARLILSTSSSFTSRYMRTINGAMSQNWGTTLTGTAGEVSNGLHVLGWLANGNSSKHFLDGNLLLTGNASTTASLMSSGQIGSDTNNNWHNTAGNTIHEIVIFNGDPTGLPGWSAFQADQLARFS